ncbi:transcriptional regulator family: Fungal Specific TF [Penicillium argentinense]|uniref:Transcriptional regulator family: Fungal Specific TF n=1 Tax=Penicillium argentinense TaxID=1131581 RepID=A0A9W9EXY3_9EURO|nr:transcriptional regulator family: Fungal Specific TF [Penicillium argentinense]KAJ5089905.1 transcriptional regulator family: Fungal Specific TF [Penicillium argentinense]
MPGVPTGRACDACRKQKKKCDEKQPSCARCLRLKIPCVGSGQLRFKFQEEKYYSTRAKKQQALVWSTSGSDSSLSQASSPPSTVTPPAKQRKAPVARYNARGPPESPQPVPGNELSSMASAFIATIKRTTDLRYNLWWSFGLWLEDVPRRLGTNEALDRAVDALTTAHAGFSCNQAVSMETLSKYSQALRTLSVYLDDRVHAQASSTLGAVMILLMCQMFMGPSSRMFSGHAEGAAQILKARKDFGPRDLFEAKLFLSLRGSVLFEGIFNERIDLTPEEWDTLVRSDYDSSTPDGQILACLAKAPSLMRRGRKALCTGADTVDVRDEVWTVYQECKMNLSVLKHRSVENDFSEMYNAASPSGRKFIIEFGFAHFQRSYGIGLACTLVFNCILTALDAHDGATKFDADYLSEEILDLAKRSVIWRPIGAGYLMICVSAAWAATSDESLQRRLLVHAKEFNNDFRIRDSLVLEKEMQWTKEHLCLGRSFAHSGLLEYQ